MNNEQLFLAVGEIEEDLLSQCEDYIAQRGSSKRHRRTVKRIGVIAAIAAGTALLTGAALTGFRVWFPHSFENRTEYSAAIYDIEPFKMSIELPNGCVITEDFEDPEDAKTGWSPMDIRLNGKSVGMADYNIFEIYPEAPEIHEGNFYRMVYNQLMLQEQCNWDNDYTVVKQDEVSENAVTKISVIDPEVFGSGYAAQPEDITYKPGILAFNTDLLVYVNISFEEDVFTSEQIEEIAKSIVLTR